MSQAIHIKMGFAGEERSLCGAHVTLPNGDDVTILTVLHEKVTCKRCLIASARETA